MISWAHLLLYYLKKRRCTMKLSTMEKVNLAVTFAEAGAWEKAREFYQAKRAKVGILERLRHYFAAAALAEEGLQDEAIGLLGLKKTEERGLKGFLEDVGLAHVQFHLVVVRA
jgi:hypothetical protein